MPHYLITKCSTFEQKCFVKTYEFCPRINYTKKNKPARHGKFITIQFTQSIWNRETFLMQNITNNTLLYCMSSIYRRRKNETYHTGPWETSMLIVIFPKCTYSMHLDCGRDFNCKKTEVKSQPPLHIPNFSRKKRWSGNFNSTAIWLGSS